MTQNANILSFNEVKARGASAPRTVSSKRTSRARHAYQADSSFSRSGANLRGSGGHAYQSSRFASDDFTSGIAADYRGFNSGFRSAPATDFRNASVTSATGFQGVASRYPHKGVASSDVVRHDSRNQTTSSGPLDMLLMMRDKTLAPCIREELQKKRVFSADCRSAFVLRSRTPVRSNYRGA